MQKRLTSLLPLTLRKRLWDFKVFAQKCSKEDMENFILNILLAGGKKSRTLGANYSAVLDFDLRKSPSGLKLTEIEGN